MTRPTSLSSALLVSILAACSAGNEESPRTSLDAAAPSADASPTPGVDAGAPRQDSGSPTDAVIADGGAGRVVLNEVCPSPDYLELLNVGASSVDISGWILADSEGGPGTPAKLTEALTFPQGTVVPAGARVYVQADLPDGGSACLDGGATRCFSASFGISGSRGEELYLLRPDKSVADQTGFAANAIASDKSWSRLPDGTGAFAVAAQTPNAPNR
jgi:hypothetical protein